MNLMILYKDEDYLVEEEWNIVTTIYRWFKTIFKRAEKDNIKYVCFWKDDDWDFESYTIKDWQLKLLNSHHN